METYDAIYRGILALCAIAAAVYSFITHRRARSIDDAVNHTHSGQPRIYDLAQSNAISMETLAKQVDDLAKKVSRLDVIDGRVAWMDDAVALLQSVAHDLVDWRQSYEGSAFKDAATIGQFVDDVDKRFVRLEGMLREHIAWETDVKYTELESLMKNLSMALRSFHEEQGDPLPSNLPIGEALKQRRRDR